MATASDLPIILYCYEESANARRIVWYLTLRRIPYFQCIQPLVIPRPDLKEKLGIVYRRIPVLSIGRDVYLETRLIIEKLEQLFPASAAHPGISGVSGEHKAIEALLSRLITDGGPFLTAAQLLPPELVVELGQQFIRDRSDLLGVKESDMDTVTLPLSPEGLTANRPVAGVEMRQVFALFESTLLADGREWLLKTANGPSLADIEGIWPLHWLTILPGALPANLINKQLFPKVFAWIERFQRVLNEKQVQNDNAPQTLDGSEAAAAIVGAPYAEAEGSVAAVDPVVAAVGLEKGTDVLLWPTDWGFLHKDQGKLVGINETQFVIETRGTFGSVRVHAHRHGFKIAKAGDNGTRL